RKLRPVPQRTPQRPRARAAVVQLPRLDRAPVMRALPSGRSLLVGFAIVLGSVGLYVLARETPMFAVQRIEVVGAPAPVAAHVRAALAPIEGTSLLGSSAACRSSRTSSRARTTGSSRTRSE